MQRNGLYSLFEVNQNYSDTMSLERSVMIELASSITILFFRKKFSNDGTSWWW
jgi:hypothetical protein